jgi:hypothetical protein
MTCFCLVPPPFIESHAFPFIGSRGGRDAGGCLRSEVLSSAVEAAVATCSENGRPSLGHHGDVKDKAVKRSRVLWRAGLASLLTGGWSRPDRGRVEVGRRGMDKAEPQDFRGTTLVVFCLEGDQWWNSARHCVYSDSLTGFHRPFWDGQ